MTAQQGTALLVNCVPCYWVLLERSGFLIACSEYLEYSHIRTRLHLYSKFLG